MKSACCVQLPVFVLVMVQAVVAMAAEKLEPWSGRAASQLELMDLRGNRQDLKALRGKVVLVNFWATWCEPCRHEMPSIQRLRDRVGDKRLAVLLVNVDEPDARVRRYVEEVRLDLPVVMDPGKRVVGQWGVKVLPSSFLVGRDGRIRYRVIGDIDWNGERAVQVIDRLLGER